MSHNEICGKVTRRNLAWIWDLAGPTRWVGLWQPLHAACLQTLPLGRRSAPVLGILQNSVTIKYASRSEYVELGHIGGSTQMHPTIANSGPGCQDDCERKTVDALQMTRFPSDATGPN